MFSIWKDCSFEKWDDELKSSVVPLHCGNNDLDDFFANDAVLYDEEMLGRTYVWVSDDQERRIVAAVTLANDGIKSRLTPRPVLNRMTRPIDNHKRGRSYPAVLIGRLGVDENYRGKGYHVGRQIVDFLRIWFSSKNNKTGCRFLVVDAYNNEGILSFYTNCGFKFLYPDEAEEKEFYGIPAADTLRTRMMYFDLK